ncbi:acetyltransferase [Cupriavidus basilensis]|uniref:acetyltransferase n=1 Tax=Cupriavidus basilensis TaxID=68895 RepID=UPI0023E89D4D|nr:acetyltransferase [Cupriavidus basilensis]MDF3886626.1 acetyltransferase [Cupriavidus basilensis]
MTKDRLILVGGGDFGRELINWVNHAAATGCGRSFCGFLDKNSAALDKYSYRLTWLGTIEDFTPQADDLFVIGVADPAIKRKIVGKLKSNGARFASIIHPSAVVSENAVLGEGVVICPQAVISCDTYVGDFVAINCLSSIGHDARVGDFSTLSAHVDLTGFVQVGESTFFGTGAKVLPKVKIGNRVRIGAGATIMRSVPDDSVMYAMPAKRL